MELQCSYDAKKQGEMFAKKMNEHYEKQRKKF